MRASGRSTLLMTRMTGSPASSVLRSTNRVCGSGPSLASTSSTTPSTMDRPRSTSPPKSAWPGVSMMLIGQAAVLDRGVLGQDRDALFALQVAGVHDPVGRPRSRPGRRRTARASRRPAWSCRGRRARRWPRCAGHRGWRSWGQWQACEQAPDISGEAAHTTACLQCIRLANRNCPPRLALPRLPAGAGHVLPDHPGRDAGHDAPVRDLAPHHRARGHDHVPADGRARQDDGARCRARCPRRCGRALFTGHCRPIGMSGSA